MTQFGAAREYRGHIEEMEASTGIEPLYTDLQTVQRDSQRSRSRLTTRISICKQSFLPHFNAHKANAKRNDQICGPELSTIF